MNVNFVLLKATEENIVLCLCLKAQLLLQPCPLHITVPMETTACVLFWFYVSISMLLMPFFFPD